MNEGVKILLERMKTNPEEFIAESNYGATKWGTLLQEYRPYLDKEDLEVFDAAHKETIFVIMKQRFTEAVMKELLAPEEDDSLGKPWYTAQMGQKGSVLGGQTPVRSSVTLNNTNAVGTWGTSAASSVLDAQKYQMEQMKLHLDAHRDLLKEEEKKSKTLFGKLFNYS